MFRAELELTDFMDTKSVTGYKLCKWLTITVKGKWYDPFFIPQVIHLEMKKWRYSLAELFLQLIVVGELGARLLRHADTGLAILEPRQCSLLCSISDVISDLIPGRLSVLSYLEMATAILCQRFLQFQTWSSLVSQICLIQYSRVLYHFCIIWKSENNYNQ